MNQIETARILIRPYRPSDADSMAGPEKEGNL